MVNAGTFYAFSGVSNAMSFYATLQTEKKKKVFRYSCLLSSISCCLVQRARAYFSRRCNYILSCKIFINEICRSRCGCKMNKFRLRLRLLYLRKDIILKYYDFLTISSGQLESFFVQGCSFLFTKYQSLRNLRAKGGTRDERIEGCILRKNTLFQGTRRV